MSYNILGIIVNEKARGRLRCLDIEDGADDNIFYAITGCCEITIHELSALYQSWDVKKGTKVYTLDTSNDGSKTQCFAVVNLKDGYWKLQWIQTAPKFKNKGLGYLLLLHTIHECLKVSIQVKLENATTPLTLGAYIYGKTLSHHFLVNVAGGVFYEYKKLNKLDRSRAQKY